MAVRSVPWARTCSDTISWRQDQALSTTIFILRQTGPTGFLLKEEDQSKKFKVYLGDPHSCTCPDFKKEPNGLCKHICWLILKKFRVPRQNAITWQRGLVDRELNEILRGLAARQEPRQTANTRKYAALAQKTADEEGKSVIEQREIGEDDVCPICQEELLSKRLPVTYCKFGCGNSVHIKCMKVWAEHQQSQGKTMIECPFCREDFGPMTLLQQEFRNSGKDARADRLNEHLGVTCNKCHVCPIAGKHYKCNVCADFSLCQKCFNTPIHPEHHFSFRQRSNQRWRPAPRSNNAALPDAVVNNLMNRDIGDADYEMLLQLDSGTNNEGSDLTEETIRLFPTERVRPNGLLLRAGEQCRVCLRPYQEGQFVRRLPCRHKFHKDCIDEWLLHRRPTCPVDGTTYTNNSVRVMMEANRQRSKRLAEESSRQTSNTSSSSNHRPTVQSASTPALEIPGIGYGRLTNGSQNESSPSLASQDQWTENRADNSQVRSQMGGFFGIFPAAQQRRQGGSVKDNRGRVRGRGNSQTHLPNTNTGSGVTLGNVADGIDTIITHSRASSSTSNNANGAVNDVIASLYGRGLNFDYLNGIMNVEASNMPGDIALQSELQEGASMPVSEQNGLSSNIDHDTSSLSVTVNGTNINSQNPSRRNSQVDSGTPNSRRNSQAERTSGQPNTTESVSQLDSGISSLSIGGSAGTRRQDRTSGRPPRGNNQRRAEPSSTLQPQPPSIPLPRATEDLGGLTLGSEGSSGPSDGVLVNRPPAHTDPRRVGRLRNKPLYRDPRSSSRGRRERSRSRDRANNDNSNRGTSSLYIGHDPTTTAGFISNFTVHDSPTHKARPPRPERQTSEQNQTSDLDFSLSGTTINGT